MKFISASISSFIILVIHSILFQLIKMDLPIHCTKSEIVGKWKIYATDLYEVKSGHEMKCGHVEPSTEGTSWRAETDLPYEKEFEIELKNDDNAELINKDKSENGKWTMIYNEGFDMNFKNLTFFAFNKYIVQRNKTFPEILTYRSLCYSTCIGWYHTNDNQQWGCYRAAKVGVNENTTVYSRDRNLTKEDVVYGDPTYRKQLNNIMRFKSKVSEVTSPGMIHRFYFEKIKNMKKHWTAELYPQFINMTMKELNEFAGISRERKQLSQYSVNDYLMRSSFKEDENKTEKFLEFPKEFDWRDKLKPTQSQGGCGSCYVFSAMRMLESRIKILFNDDVKLSVQHPLDCSYYNQGCKGGFSSLAMKFSKDFELVPEDCHPYKKKKGNCSESCDLAKLDFPYIVESYSYLGGSYGRSNEVIMMEELYKNGPFVVSIEPEYNFMHYKSGVYSSDKNTSWFQEGATAPEWRKVDHSVLLVGWGEDESTQEKYWLIQNSWGKKWGENGFFRIKRGVDELHVESMGEVATPGLKKIGLIEEESTPANKNTTIINPSSKLIKNRIR